MADLLDDYAVLGDTELVTLIRHGSLGAWWEIERRHGHAMRRLNRILDPIGRYGDPSADAHTIAYHSLAQGVGPATALRPYLLMLVQRLHTVRLASRGRPFLGATPTFTSVPFHDLTQIHSPDVPVVAAFAALPEAWQTALWHLDVEHESPAEVGILLGLEPRALTGLAKRARAELASRVGADRPLSSALLGSILSSALLGSDVAVAYRDRLTEPVVPVVARATEYASRHRMSLAAAAAGVAAIAVAGVVLGQRYGGDEMLAAADHSDFQIARTTTMNDAAGRPLPRPNRSASSLGRAGEPSPATLTGTASSAGANKTADPGPPPAQIGDPTEKTAPQPAPSAPDEPLTPVLDADVETEGDDAPGVKVKVITDPVGGPGTIEVGAGPDGVKVELP